MMTLIQRNLTLFALAPCLIMAGCHTPTSRDMHNAAKDRWQQTRAGILYSLAVQQFENGELDKAEATCAQAMETAPGQAAFFELASRIAMERGYLERAYHLVEESIALDPDRPQAHYVLGVILERWQRYERALAAYEKCYELQRDQPRGLLAAAEMLVKLDRADEAIHRLEQTLAYFEHNAAIRATLARIHMLQRDYLQAARFYHEAVVLNPESRAALEQLALAEYAAGRHADAATRLAGILSDPANQDRDDLRLILGDCYMATGRPVQAGGIFLDIVRRHENDVAAWIRLGQAAWLVEDLDRVEHAADRIFALSPRRHESYVLRGLLHQREERLDEAVAAFEQAGKLAPESSAPWLLKGVALERRGDMDAAADAYRRALEIRPEDERARRLLTALHPG